MNPITLLDFVNIFFAGMLAGSEFIIHYGVRGPSVQLDDHAQLQLRQALVLKLRVLIPALFLPTAVLGIALLFFNGGTPGFWYRCAAILAVCVWVLIRIVGTVPINSATADWQLSSPPKNWKELIKRAERFHIAGTWAAILAFAFFLSALALKLAA